MARSSAARDAASMPRVGSSSSSTGAPPTATAAIATRWRSPPDSERGCAIGDVAAARARSIHDSTAPSSVRPRSRSVSAISARTVGRNSRLDGSWGT